jgi:predicted enzyme related to lactoylglutathione lyase
MARFNSVQLPVTDLAATKSFYEGAFGWAFTDYGSTYSCTLTGDVDLGLQGDATEAPAAPLPVIAVDDLEAAHAAVRAAGGTITQPIFEFPGGRGFHFKDPSGNELAVSQDDPAP